MMSAGQLGHLIYEDLAGSEAQVASFCICKGVGQGQMQVKGVHALLILGNAEFTHFSWGSLPLSYLQQHLCLYLTACLKTYLNQSQGRSCWYGFLT